MPAEGYSRGTVQCCCQTKGRREAYCTSQIHLPNSSPESKKRETISTVHFSKLCWDYVFGGHTYQFLAFKSKFIISCLYCGHEVEINMWEKHNTGSWFDWAKCKILDAQLVDKVDKVAAVTPFDLISFSKFLNPMESSIWSSKSVWVFLKQINYLDFINVW